jgi:hypothetical protein
VRPATQSATRPIPIVWLDRPVRLLRNAGPMVLGLSQDTVMGEALLRQWQLASDARGVDDRDRDRDVA